MMAGDKDIELKEYQHASQKLINKRKLNGNLKRKKTPNQKKRNSLIKKKRSFKGSLNSPNNRNIPRNPISQKNNKLNNKRTKTVLQANLFPKS